jgi:hypothetical protein
MRARPCRASTRSQQGRQAPGGPASAHRRRPRRRTIRVASLLRPSTPRHAPSSPRTVTSRRHTAGKAREPTRAQASSSPSVRCRRRGPQRGPGPGRAGPGLVITPQPSLLLAMLERDGESKAGRHVASARRPHPAQPPAAAAASRPASTEAPAGPQGAPPRPRPPPRPPPPAPAHARGGKDMLTLHSPSLHVQGGLQAVATTLLRGGCSPCIEINIRISGKVILCRISEEGPS